jgi:hypothetical protein
MITAVTTIADTTDAAGSAFSNGLNRNRQSDRPSFGMADIPPRR